jgi:hypothetical protein
LRDGSKEYRLFTDAQLTYNQAQASCEAEGGSLASDASDEEHAFLTEYLFSTAAVDVVWIGGSYSGSPRTLRWEDGSDPTNGFAGSLPFEEPLPADDDPATCLVFDIAKRGAAYGRWNVKDCDLRRFYLCERDFSTSTSSSTTTVRPTTTASATASTTTASSTTRTTATTTIAPTSSMSTTTVAPTTTSDSLAPSFPNPSFEDAVLVPGGWVPSASGWTLSGPAGGFFELRKKDWRLIANSVHFSFVCESCSFLPQVHSTRRHCNTSLVRPRARVLCT